MVAVDLLADGGRRRGKPRDPAAGACGYYGPRRPRPDPRSTPASRGGGRERWPPPFSRTPRSWCNRSPWRSPRTARSYTGRYSIRPCSPADSRCAVAHRGAVCRCNASSDLARLCHGTPRATSIRPALVGYPPLIVRRTNLRLWHVRLPAPPFWFRLYRESAGFPVPDYRIGARHHRGRHPWPDGDDGDRTPDPIHFRHGANLRHCDAARYLRRRDLRWRHRGDPDPHARHTRRS